MRITAKISSSAGAGLSRFPCLNSKMDDCLDSSGVLDEGKMRRALDCEQITFGSRDTRRVLCFALEYLEQMESVITKLSQELNRDGSQVATVERVESGASVPHRVAQTPGDRACERRMKRGRHAYCRTDITDCADGIHVRLSVQNPRDVVGNAEALAREYAVICARVLRYIKTNIHTAEIHLIEGDGAQGVLSDAAEADLACELRARRASCPNLTATGYCSPICPRCALYEKGRCREP